MLGLVVTLITQSGGNASRDAPAQAPAASREVSTPETSPTPGTPSAADPGATSANDVVTTSSPSPSPSKAPVKILRTGDFTLLKGYSADLEHGTVGTSVANPDMAWNGGDTFAAMNGRVARSSEGATPKNCAKTLDYASPTGWMVPNLEGAWFCMPTSANHLAAVEWLDSGEDGVRYHYIVWDVTAPSDDD